MGIAVGARDAAKLGPFIDEITALSRPAKAYTVDATVEAQVENFVASAEADLGPAVAAIYNVGRRSMKSILEMESGEFEAVWRASCLGGMVFGREVAARMVPRASGTILFIGHDPDIVIGAGRHGVFLL